MEMKKKDVEKFEDVWAEYHDAIYRFIAYATNYCDETMDIFHDTYIAAYSSWHSLNHYGARKVWIYTIAKNMIIKHKKDKLKLSFIPDVSLLPMDNREIDITTRMDMEKYVEPLEEPWRTYFFLNVVFGITTKEIADMYGLSHEMLRKRIYRMKQTIVGKMRQDEGDKT